MKIIFPAIVALAITSTSASACSTTTINKLMASAIQKGSPVLNVSNLLGCSPDQIPTPNSASSTLTWSVVSSINKQQIVVDFVSGGAALARYQEIPLVPAVSTSNNNSGVQDAAVAAAAIALAISRGYFVGSPAASGCTPATINPSAISRILPHSSIEAVEATLACMPSEWVYTPEVNATTYAFMVPLLKVSVLVVVDSTGVAFAQYINFTNPVEASYNGALRAEPPLAPSMMPAAGVFPTIP